MWKKSFLLLFYLLITSLSFCQKLLYKKEVHHLVQYVDTRIGVIDKRGNNCVIGPQIPFGSINPSPDTPDGGNSGYAPGKPVRGFSQLHVSGTGWGKYGHFLVSPQIGLNIGEEDHDSPISDETATASYYKVNLKRYNILTEISPTAHCAMYRFSFPRTDSAYILIDVTHSLTRDIAKNIGGTVFANEVTVDSISKNKVWGMIKYEGGFGQGEYKLYFYSSFSQKATLFGVWKNKTLLFNSSSAKLSNKEDRIGCFLKFDSHKKNNIVLMKIAISFKSIDKAKEYCKNEIPKWDFNTVKQSCDSIWNNALSSILLEGATAKQNKMFYTAMYHSMLMPRDRTGDFAGWNDHEQLWDDQYATWDTWRTLFPLMVLINPEMVKNNISSYINRLKHNHRVEDAFIAGIDMFPEQGGDNVDNVIADAIIKGVPGINIKEAYKVLKYDADYGRDGVQEVTKKNQLDTINGLYKTLGWIPASVMSCSLTLEYAYNDFCVAEIAKKLGFNKDYKKYFDRSQLWSNLWNQNLESKGFKGFICPKSINGKWISIDPTSFPGSWKNYFYEANSWTYSFFVPHQLDKLISLSGDKVLYAKKLNFALQHNLIQLDNEPSFLAVRTFDVAGRLDLNCYWVNYIMNHLYDETGVPGNDDSGAMSSWYVFSALGFFPNAGQETYYVNAPFCKRIIIQRPNEGNIIINAPNASDKNIYIKSFSINGRRFKNPWFNHSDIKKGAIINYDLTDKPQSHLN